MSPLSEADTCRKHVVPKLQAAGWDDEPHSVAEQRTISDLTHSRVKLLKRLQTETAAILDRAFKGEL